MRAVSAELVTSGELDLHNLPVDDEEAIELLVRVKGIGRWSAEIYLLFAEGRLDIWPAGDLAVQASIGAILGLPARPSEKETRALGEQWTAAPQRHGDHGLASLQYQSAVMGGQYCAHLIPLPLAGGVRGGPATSPSEAHPPAPSTEVTCLG